MENSYYPNTFTVKKEQFDVSIEKMEIISDIIQDLDISFSYEYKHKGGGAHSLYINPKFLIKQLKRIKDEGSKTYDSSRKKFIFVPVNMIKLHMGYTELYGKFYEYVGHGYNKI